ncbi:CvpA family protein [Streptococcus sp. CSL10205-OR2]|uniref:CvpA family protein n=1 Tax=Streptococcus sp. CSL10205-OR2 TaxID=2980558 RepID=UPI0021DA2F38|nr:CvpA family protein [Streptococcus sp. CSL10205-OR2]MCU9533039.1 CvpA family protein [Streptococcus sp. CSL10205-OR2]
MLSLIILLLLAWHFYIGYSRGIILQGYYFLATIISLIISSLYYKPLAKAITLWVPYSNPSEDVKVFFFTDVPIFELDKVYYAGVAFLSIFVASYLAFRLLGIFMNLMDLDLYDTLTFNCISGALSVLMTMLFFNMALSILATVPIPFIQNILSKEVMTQLLITFFPSAFLIKMLWVTNILK